MKKILFILCLLFPIIVSAQPINWNKFNEEKLNRVLFDNIDSGRFYSFVDFPEANKVHWQLIWNCNKMGKSFSATKFVTKLNQNILIESIAVIDSIPVDCDHYRLYEEIAERCIKDWNNPSDLFGLKGFITVTSYLHKKTNTLYVIGLVEPYTSD